MDWITNILSQVLGDTKRNIIIIALACADGWYVYNYSWNVTAQCVLIFCVVWLLAACVVYLWQLFCQHLNNKRSKAKSIRKEQFKAAQERGQAEDVFERMNEHEKRTICYAILSGKKSHQYANQFSYQLNAYNSCIYMLEQACTLPGTFDSIIGYTNDNGKMTLSFYNPQLIDVVSEYITANSITKDSIQSEIDAEVAEFNRNIQELHNIRR